MNKGKFGQLIREYRTKKGLTQKELAEALGYESPQFVSLLERDASKVPISTLGALIVILDMKETEILSTLLETYQAEVLTEIQRGKTMASESKKIS